MNTATINSAKDAAGIREGANGSDAGKNGKESEFFVNFLTAIGMTDPNRLKDVEQGVNVKTNSTTGDSKDSVTNEDAGFIINFLTAIGMANPEKFSDLATASDDNASLRASDITDLQSFFGGFLKAIHKFQDQAVQSDKTDLQLLAGLVDKMAANISLKNNNILADEAKVALGIMNKLSANTNFASIVSNEISPDILEKITNLANRGAETTTKLSGDLNKLPDDLKTVLEDVSGLSTSKNSLKMTGESTIQTPAPAMNATKSDELSTTMQSLKDLVGSKTNDLTGIKTNGLASTNAGDSTGIKTNGLTNNNAGDLSGIKTNGLTNSNTNDFAGFKTIGLTSQPEASKFVDLVDSVTNGQQTVSGAETKKTGNFVELTSLKEISANEVVNASTANTIVANDLEAKAKSALGESLNETANTNATNSKIVELNESFVFDTETGEIRIKEVNISREAKNTTGDLLKNVLNLGGFSANGEYKPDENSSNGLFSGMNFSKTGMAQNSISASGEDNYESYHTFSSVNVKDFASTVNGLVRKMPDESNSGAKLILNPASLGTVFVEINIKDGIAKINIKTETAEAAKAIEGQISVLQDKLAQNGIKTEAIQVAKSADKFDFLGQGLAQGGREGSNLEERKTKRDFLNSFRGRTESVELKNGEIEQKIRLFASKLVEKYV